MKTSPNTLKGIALVLVAMAILPFIDVCAKFLGQQGVPVIQMVWGRFFFGAFFTLPFAMRMAGPAAFTPVNPWFNTARAVLLILGTAFFFLSLKYLPIADTLAIYFVQPILITALSPFLLGEHVGIRRWTTVAIGFIGVLIIIRPGFQTFNLGVIFALLAGLSSAFYILVTRHLTGKADAMVTTFQSSTIGAIALTVALPFFWSAMTANQWLLLVLLGAIAIAGHYLITRAYDYAEASLLSPFNYTEMIMAVAAGWWFFGDFPDNYTFLGVSILIACAIYISWRERVRSIAALSQYGGQGSATSGPPQP
jgi:drug/metabolite transporter (DMT)-like permease